MNFNIFWGFQKKDYFWGMIFLWIFFLRGGGGRGGGLSRNWAIFRVHFYAFYGLFVRSRYRMGVFLGVAKISNIFWVLEIFDIFGGER